MVESKDLGVAISRPRCSADGEATVRVVRLGSSRYSVHELRLAREGGAWRVREDRALLDVRS